MVIGKWLTHKFSPAALTHNVMEKFDNNVKIMLKIPSALTKDRTGEEEKETVVSGGKYMSVTLKNKITSNDNTRQQIKKS